MDIPEEGGTGAQLKVLEGNLGQPLVNFRMGLAGGGETGEIALDIGGEDGHPQPRKTLGQNLQGDCFAGAGGPGDEAVTVAHGGQLADRFAGGGADGELQGISHKGLP